MEPLPPQQGLSYSQLVAQVAERVLQLALSLPALSAPTKQVFICYSRTLTHESASGGAGSGSSIASSNPAAAPGVEGADGGAAPEVQGPCGVRSLGVARVAAELVRSAAAPGLPLHPEDRWAFINLAAELLRP